MLLFKLLKNKFDNLPDKLNNVISDILNTWNNYIEIQSNLPAEIIAFNFGLQKADISYELYLEGFDWFEYDDELWLLDSVWNPQLNFVSLPSEFREIEISHLLNTYANIVSNQIASVKFILPKQIKSVTVCLSNGRPIRIV